MWRKFACHGHFSSCSAALVGFSADHVGGKDNTAALGSTPRNATHSKGLRLLALRPGGRNKPLHACKFWVTTTHHKNVENKTGPFLSCDQLCLGWNQLSIVAATDKQHSDLLTVTYAEARETARRLQAQTAAHNSQNCFERFSRRCRGTWRTSREESNFDAGKLTPTINDVL